MRMNTITAIARALTGYAQNDALLSCRASEAHAQRHSAQGRQPAVAESSGWRQKYQRHAARSRGIQWIHGVHPCTPPCGQVPLRVIRRVVPDKIVCDCALTGYAQNDNPPRHAARSRGIQWVVIKGDGFCDCYAPQNDK